jgi:YlmC/YmxH family sporulation protein
MMRKGLAEMAICDTTFNELRAKDVVNVCDCKKFGRIIDVVIDLKTGRVKGIIIPGCKGLGIFRQPEDIFIPWKNIVRIGGDVILIEVTAKNPKPIGKLCDDDCKIEFGSKNLRFFDDGCDDEDEKN